MTYFVKRKGSHYHKWMVDVTTGDYVCLCGAVKGVTEKRKYHNHTEVYNGLTYHSKFEARYAAELDLRLRAKDIDSWERQIRIPLVVNGYKITAYIIDFVVKMTTGEYEWVEVKGYETDLWRIKFRLFEALFDQIRRTEDDRIMVVKEKNFKPKYL